VLSTEGHPIQTSIFNQRMAPVRRRLVLRTEAL